MSRGHSIQAGRLCYTNGCAVEVVARLDVYSAPPFGGLGICAYEPKGFVFPLVGLLDSVTGETQI